MWSLPSLQGIRFWDSEMVMAEPLLHPTTLQAWARQWGRWAGRGKKCVQREAWRGGGVPKGPKQQITLHEGSQAHQLPPLR